MKSIVSTIRFFIIILVITFFSVSIQAQNTYTNQGIDTMMVEISYRHGLFWSGDILDQGILVEYPHRDSIFLFGDILYQGEVEDTIQLVFRKKDSSILVVLNENYLTDFHTFYDSIFMLLINKYDFTRFDNDYPYYTVYSDKYLDSILGGTPRIGETVDRSRILNRIELASIDCRINIYPELTNSINFFVRHAKSIFQHCNNMYFTFIDGMFYKESLKVSVDHRKIELSWIVIFDQDGEIIKFQYYWGQNLWQKFYSADPNDI